MPGAPGSPSSIVAQPPSRFRVPSGKGEAAPESEPTGARPSLIGLPPPRPSSGRSSRRSSRCQEASPSTPPQAAPAPPSGSDTPRSSALKRSCSADNVAIKNFEHLGRSSSLPVLGNGAPFPVSVQQQITVTELVNLAAKAAEIEEKQIESRRSSDPRPGLSSKDNRNTYSSLHRQSSLPSQPSHNKDSSNSPRQKQHPAPSSTHSSSSRLHTLPKLATGSSTLSRSLNSTSASTTNMNCIADGLEQLKSSSSSSSATAPQARDNTSRGSSCRPATAFSDAGQQQALLAQQLHPQQLHAGAAALPRQPMHCRFPSDCESDDSAVNTAASIISSASCSSLCSAASYGSNASTCTTGSRPKSILLHRSSSGSTGSGASTPRCIKRVSWKDGQAGCDLEVGGNALVAVKFLEDCTEMRKLRRDTWPENPSARREAKEAAAREQHQQQSSLARAIELLQEQPAKLFDWRERLKELQQERRQQRLNIVRASWQAQQQQQLAAAAEDNEEGQVEDMEVHSEVTPGKKVPSAGAASHPQGPAVIADSNSATAVAAVCCSKAGSAPVATIQIKAVAGTISTGSF